jgi:REP element-mobilizing transposase RayT
MLSMDRYWLLTNTCYGNWLPGDRRGFVGHVQEHRPSDSAEPARVRHSLPGSFYDAEMPGLEQASRNLLKGPPVHLTARHAEVLLGQFRETAAHRGWKLLAVAIMFNHFHLVVGVMGDPSPSKILGDFKSWGTRSLNDAFGPTESGTWWTERGSKRKLRNNAALIGGVRYVLYDQPNAILTWSPEGESAVS